MFFFLSQMHHPIQMKPADSENRSGEYLENRLKLLSRPLSEPSSARGYSVNCLRITFRAGLRPLPLQLLLRLNRNYSDRNRPLFSRGREASNDRDTRPDRGRDNGAATPLSDIFFRDDETSQLRLRYCTPV